MQHIIDQLNLFVKLDGNVYDKKEDVDLSVLVSTHFKTMDEFSMYMKQWEFERELDESITRAKLKNRSEYINI